MQARTSLQYSALRASTMVQSNQMSFFKYNASKQMRMPVSVLGSPAERRSFSLPDHMMMEMPNLSPTMEKGNIKEWNVKVGDQIQPGDVLCGIETDKAVVDFEMQEEGYVAKLLYDAGSKDIPLGTPLAILVENEADIAAFANYDGSSGADAAPSTPAA